MKRRDLVPVLTAAMTVMAVAPRPRAAERVETPPRAPRAAVAQDVGLTRISVEYRSPAVHGRHLWGARVPFGEPWLTGDSPRATIEFSRDVKIGGKTLPAGTYALVATPAPTAWTFAFERRASGDSAAEPSPIRVEVRRAQRRARAAALRVLELHIVLGASRSRVGARPRLGAHRGRHERADPLGDRRPRSARRRARRRLRAHRQVSPLQQRRQEGRRHRPREGRVGFERAAALEKSVGAVGAPRIARSDDSPLVGPPSPPSALAAGELTAPSERSAPRAAKATRAPGAEEIGPVISKGRPAIEVCYQRALRRDPRSAAGRSPSRSRSECPVA